MCNLAAFSSWLLYHFNGLLMLILPSFSFVGDLAIDSLPNTAKNFTCRFLLAV